MSVPALEADACKSKPLLSTETEAIARALYHPFRGSGSHVELRLLGPWPELKVRWRSTISGLYAATGALLPAKGVQLQNFSLSGNIHDMYAVDSTCCKLKIGKIGCIIHGRAVAGESVATERRLSILVLGSGRLFSHVTYLLVVLSHNLHAPIRYVQKNIDVCCFQVMLECCLQ